MLEMIVNIKKSIDSSRLLVIAFLLLISKQLFLLYLNFNSGLMLDESATLWISRLNFHDAAINPAPYPMHPPYYSLAWLWTALLQLDLRIQRLFAVAISFHSIYLLYLISIWLLTSKNKFLRLLYVTAGLFSQAEFNYLAWQARPYPLILWFSLLSIYFLIRALKNNKLSFFLLYVISSSLVIYTHPIFIYLFSIHLLIKIHFQQSWKDFFCGKFIISFISGILIGMLLLYLSGAFEFIERVQGAYKFNQVNPIESLSIVLDSMGIIGPLILLLVCVSDYIKDRQGSCNINLAMVIFFTSLTPVVWLALSAKIFGKEIIMARYAYLLVIAGALSLAFLFEYLEKYRHKASISLLLIIFLSFEFNGIISRNGLEAINSFIVSKNPEAESCAVFISSPHPESKDPKWIVGYPRWHGWTAPLIDMTQQGACKVGLIGNFDNKEGFQQHVEDVLLDNVAVKNIYLALLYIEKEEGSHLIEPSVSYLMDNKYQLAGTYVTEDSYFKIIHYRLAD